MKKPKRLNTIWLEHEGSVMTYGVKNGCTITMNKTGAYILQLCDGKHTVEEIINKVGEKFRINPKTCEDDVLRFLEKLGKKGLIYEYE